MALTKTASDSVRKASGSVSSSPIPTNTGDLRNVALRFRIDPKADHVTHVSADLDRLRIDKAAFKNKIGEVLGKEFTDKNLNLDTSEGWAEVERMLWHKGEQDLQKMVPNKPAPSPKAKELTRQYNLTPESAEQIAKGDNTMASIPSHTSAAPQSTVLNFSPGKKEDSSGNRLGSAGAKTEQSVESKAAWKRMNEAAQLMKENKVVDLRRDPMGAAGKLANRFRESIFGLPSTKSLEALTPVALEPDTLLEEEQLVAPPIVEEVPAPVVEQPAYTPKPSSDIGIKAVEKPQTRSEQLFSALKPAKTPPPLGSSVAKGKQVLSKVSPKGAVGKVQKLKSLVKTGIDGIQALAGNPRAIKNLALTALKSRTLRRAAAFVGGAATGFGIYMMNAILGAGLGAVGGAVIGGILGSVLGPLGTVAGAAAGAYVGANLGSIAAGVQTALGSIFTGVGAAASGIWATLTGGSVVAATSMVGIVGVGIAFAFSWWSQISLESAFYSYAMENQTLVTVTKSVDKSKLPNNPNDQVVYTIQISTNSLDEVPIQIEDRTIVITPEKEVASLVMPAIASVTPVPEGGNSKALPTTVSKDSPITIVYEPLRIVGPQFNDSVIKNVVAVTGTSGENSETVSAEADVIIGSVIDPPYGYPMGGAITSLDDELITAKENGQLLQRPHSALNIDGGLDISPRSADIGIYSTLTGEVTRSTFDKTFGGLVQIKAGSYTATFMHMDSEGLPKQGAAVVRGQQIGKLYMGFDLQNATAPHLHYQVTRDGQNLFFGAKRETQTGQRNYGPCLINGVRTNFIQPEPALADRPVSVVRMTDCTEGGGSTPVPPQPTNVCPLAPAGNPCSVENLRQYFPTAEAADKASRICYRESRGVRTVVNNGCADSPQRHNEYSVGLFQINLAPQAHPDMCPEGTFTNSKDACIFNQKLRDECFAKWTSQTCGSSPTDPLNDCNIKKAVELSNGGTNWGPWSTSRPGVCNVQ